MTFDEWQEFADPATEFILTLAESHPTLIASWQSGRIGRDIVDLLIARLVLGLEDQKEDCSAWLEETQVCLSVAISSKFTEGHEAESGG